MGDTVTANMAAKHVKRVFLEMRKSRILLSVNAEMTDTNFDWKPGNKLKLTPSSTKVSSCILRRHFS
jgi:hypothetical protein